MTLRIPHVERYEGPDQDLYTWSVAVRYFEVGAYCAIVLADNAELRAEGDIMRNCTGSYISACMSGGARLLSLRRGHDRRVATILIERERGTPRWRATDVRLRFNRAAGSELEAVALRAAKVYGRFDARQPRVAPVAPDIPVSPTGRYVFLPEPGGPGRVIPDPRPPEEPVRKPHGNPGWTSSRARYAMEERSAEDAIYFERRWRRAGPPKG